MNSRALGRVAQETCDSWVQPFHAALLVSPDIEDIQDIQEIGEVSGWIVPMFANDERIDLLDAADACCNDCYDLVRAVIDPETNDFAEELKLECFGTDILCLNAIELLPGFRGRRVGLAATWQLLNSIGRGCAVAIAKPHPIQRTSGQTSRPEMLDGFDDTAGDEGASRLATYWAKVGFRAIPSHAEYAYFDFGHRLGQSPRILKARSRRKIKNAAA